MNQPVAIERSCEGNQMVDTFVPVGIATASLRPSRARKPAIDIHPVANPCIAAAAPQITAATA